MIFMWEWVEEGKYGFNLKREITRDGFEDSILSTLVG
jgi:hypothetical protein